VHLKTKTLPVPTQLPPLNNADVNLLSQQQYQPILVHAISVYRKINDTHTELVLLGEHYISQAMDLNSLRSYLCQSIYGPLNIHAFHNHITISGSTGQNATKQIITTFKFNYCSSRPIRRTFPPRKM